MSGRLIIVTTPIGNLGDTTNRVSRMLDQCELILAEDTRVSIKLLNHLGIKKKLISCHDFNEAQRIGILKDIAERDLAIAILSDAGTPLICDPGYQIARAAIALGMTLIPLPGPSAFLLALIGSGLPCDRFVFEGFLPDKPSQQRERLEELIDEQRTMIFYIAPHKLETSLTQILDVLADRPACLARELTKLHEEFIRTNLTGLVEIARSRQLKGEMVLVVGGNDQPKLAKQSETTVRSAVKDALKKGLRAKEISSQLAKSLGWRKADIYRIAIAEIEAGIEKDFSP